MKSIIISAISFFFFILSVNQSVQATEEFEINGLKVILKQSPKDVISVRLFVEGGTANYSKEQEGIEAIAFKTAIDGGTLNKSKSQFHTESEKIGTSFGAASSYDYGNINMTCIKMFWDKSWGLFAEALLEPAFNSEEFDLIKSKMIADTKDAESDPDAHLRNLAMKHVYRDKNYSKIPEGSPESLEKITVEGAKKYFQTAIVKKRAFLIVVGNIDRKDLENKIANTLSKMPLGTSAKKEQPYQITKPSIYIENRDIATNYIRGLMSAPKMSSDDGIPMRIAMSILGDRYFVELRTKRSLSYAPSAFYAASIVNNPYNVIYISTLDAKQSMNVMVEELNKIKKDGFLEKELINKKQTFLTYYYMGQETSSSQSQALGIAEMSGGWELTETFTQNVNKTTLADINRVLDKYTKAIQWTYLGKQDMVNKADFVQMKQNMDGKKPY